MILLDDDDDIVAGAILQGMSYGTHKEDYTGMPCMGCDEGVSHRQCNSLSSRDSSKDDFSLIIRLY
eukprot:scaffold22622_cov37-Attheya_sp.AAC.1